MMNGGSTWRCLLIVKSESVRTTNRGMNVIRVLIVDDSAIVRKMLSHQFSRVPDLEVVGVAPDAYVARDMIVAAKPHVITLDLEMPRMDGLTFLRKLMQHHPMPVVVFSSLTEDGSDLALEALQAGAVDVICKPGPMQDVASVTEELVAKIKDAAKANVRRPVAVAERSLSSMWPSTEIEAARKVVAIGASAGGTSALEVILQSMPGNAPGCIITQHMPPFFIPGLAARLNQHSKMDVKQAEDGDLVLPGIVLIAPGDKHLLLRCSGTRCYVTIKDGPRVNGHRPSVDVMFQSVAKAAKADAVGVLLTGMGKDGAQGLLEMREAGAGTIVQDEATCVVFGMPRAAIELGAVEHISRLERISSEILRVVKGRSIR